MPYIGNNHIAGDHTNNFKVLDDISSFTATFDGSASSVIDTTNNTIRVVEHRFIQGQRVTYTNGGGGNIGGLTTGTAYFVIFDSASTIKLATSASNAANSTAINLSAVGTGSSHTLNVAFDGVNKKFKLTHSSGTDARLNNASQINIAINNVVQRPNLDPNNFTDGFALEDNHKIVFQTAPTVNDIFWGSIIANTLTTFDISDHKIDTFTGDGSTTEFTLSHTPANNESLMVTINGVLQHPSNASTARAYTLIASIIQFTAAPANGDEIQVRHLGFAGATTADVSGFYGRTGNVALTANDHITTGDITARNINASGIITASQFVGNLSSNVGGGNANFTGIVTAGVFKGGDIEGRNLKVTGLSTFVGDASFSGNVSIGGTLTYEDVTNIDSVGIVTARNNIHLEDYIFHKGDLSAYFGFVSDDNILFGTTSSQRLQIHADGEVEIKAAAAGQTVLSCTGAYASGNTVDIQTWARSDGAVKAAMKYSHGTNSMNFGTNTNHPLIFQSNNLERVRINGDGNVSITNDLDVDGHTNLDNLSIAGVTTFADNVKAVFGNGGDLEIFHRSADNNSIIKESGSGALSLETNGSNISLYDTANSRTMAQFNTGGSITLNHGATTRLETTNTGINVTGNTVADGLTIDGNVSIAGVTTTTQNIRIGADNKYLKIGAGDDLSFVHTGGQSFITNSTGHLTGRSASYTWENLAGSTEYLRIASNGRVGVNTTNPQTNLYSMNEIAAGDGNRRFIGMQTKIVDGTAVGEIRTTYYSGANGSYPHIRFVTSDTERLRITTNGYIGVGVANPNHLLHLHRGDSGNSYTQYTNTTTGSASSDGVWLGMGSDENCYLWHNENKEMYLGTNNTTRLHITSSGYVTTKSELWVGGSAPVLRWRDSTHGEKATARIDGSDLYFEVNNSERLRIDSGGRVTTPTQPMVGCRHFSQNGNNVFNDGNNIYALTFHTVDVNIGSHFNNTTGIFTCPVAGNYFISCNLNLRQNQSSWSSLYVLRKPSGGNFQKLSDNWATSAINNTWAPISASHLVSCGAGDELVMAYNSGYSAPNNSSASGGVSMTIFLFG